MTTAYTAEVTRPDDSRFWLVHIPELQRHTQAPNLAAVEPMARDLIAVLLNVPADSLEVTVVIRLPDSVQARLELANRLTVEAVQLQTRSAAARRAAARDLKARGLTVREIGAALGVSPGRAQQLLTAGKEQQQQVTVQSTLDSTCLG